MDGNKVELSCARFCFKTSKLRTSKAKQRLAAQMFSSHPKVQKGCHNKDGGTLHSVVQDLHLIDEKYGKPRWKAILEGDIPIF